MSLCFIQEVGLFCLPRATKAALRAASILSILVFLTMPARGQFSSYVDDHGNLVYTNDLAPNKRKAEKSPSNSAPHPAASSETGASPAAAPSSMTPEALRKIVLQTAEKHNVDPALVGAVISTESNWNTSAISRKGALGLMQLVPGTAQQLGVGNAFDPAQNVDAGVRYLGMMLQRYDGDLRKALAAYNAGPGVVDRFGGVPNFRETREYVRKVTSTYFRPGSSQQPFAFSAPRPIYREAAADGRVVFTNE